MVGANETSRSPAPITFRSRKSPNGVGRAQPLENPIHGHHHSKENQGVRKHPRRFLTVEIIYDDEQQERGQNHLD